MPRRPRPVKRRLTAAVLTAILLIPAAVSAEPPRAALERLLAVDRNEDQNRAAWLLFHRAAVREAVTVELTREVAASLHHARTGA